MSISPLEDFLCEEAVATLETVETTADDEERAREVLLVLSADD